MIAGRFSEAILYRLRSAVSANVMIPLLRNTLTQFGSQVIVNNIKPMAEIVSDAAARLLSSQLFGISPHDPLLLAAVSLLMVFVVLMASLLPARRASRADPMLALRHE